MNKDDIEHALNLVIYSESNKYKALNTSLANARKYKCSVDGCTNNAYASGMCNAHYIRKRKGKDLSLPVRCRKNYLKTCIDCGKLSNSKGAWFRCSRHFKVHRKRLLKEELINLLGGKCTHCNGVFPTAVYDFHHLGKKDQHVSTMLNTRSLERIANEVALCILLCANCHRILHNVEL